MIAEHCQLEMTEKQLREQLDAVYASTSWRLTAPLRFFVSLLKGQGLRAIWPKQLIIAAMHRAAAQPRLRRLGQRVLTRFPNLRMRVRRAILRGNQGSFVAREAGLASDAQMLTPAARRILHELRTAIHHTK